MTCSGLVLFVEDYGACRHRSATTRTRIVESLPELHSVGVSSNTIGQESSISSGILAWVS